MLLGFGSGSGFAAPAPDHFSFTYTTTQGDMTFDCQRAWAPLGADRIYELLTTGFFTDIGFFRVIEGFVAQFGISGDPKVAAKWEKATIKDDPVVSSNLAGTLTFATAGPNTRTTQLFINLVDNARLDSMGFAPVCKLRADGLAIAKKLYNGYRESPDQDKITHEGNAYLRKNFPRLDYIRSAKVSK